MRELIKEISAKQKSNHCITARKSRKKKMFKSWDVTYVGFPRFKKEKEN